MVGIRVRGVTLRYPLRRRLGFARAGAAATGGTIAHEPGGGYVTALDDVSLEIRAGDRIGLTGANGAGKTTFLKVLYGIYAPTAGHVQIDGRVDALFNINLGFRPGATGRRNIMLRGLINGWSRDQIEARTEEIIAFSELGEFIDLPFKSYSQGMAARLAFSIATTMTPQILLMDEWLGAGDPAFQKKARERMNALADQAGIIVLASHNAPLIEKTCNRVLEFEHGRIKSERRLYSGGAGSGPGQ
jgi:lipopolysaccharide transport system ATP-binding protein